MSTSNMRILLILSTILTIYHTVSISTTDSNYQGHLWCGGKVSGKTSPSEQQHYYSFIIHPRNNWNISSCGSYIYNYVGIYNSDGDSRGGTNGGGCSPNAARLQRTNYAAFTSGIYFISISDWDEDIDSYYALSLECDSNLLPILHYNNINISADNVTIIECSNAAPTDITAAFNVYEFYLTAAVNINMLSTVSFMVNVNDDCWKHSVFMLDEHNNWLLVASSSMYKKGIYRVITEHICSNIDPDTEYITMNCGFDVINSDIVYYQQSPWITLLEDISCGLTVKGYAHDGNAYSYEFVTNSNIRSNTMVSFSTCDTNKAKQNGLSIRQYKYLNYTPYIQDKLGYWDYIKSNSLYSNDYQDKDASCNYLELNHLLPNTHYAVTIAIPSGSGGDYTIYMECSDNSAINAPVEYEQYINYKSPSQDSLYVKPSQNNVIFCDDEKSGTLGLDSIQFYAFKAKRYQYWIEFDICNNYNDSSQTDLILDAVLNLYYYNKAKQWMNIESVKSNCTQLIYYGVRPGYYYITVEGLDSLDIGNFSIFMRCMDNEAIGYPWTSGSSKDKNNLVTIVILVAIVSMLNVLVCILCIWARKKRREQLKENRENRGREIELRYAQRHLQKNSSQPREVDDDGFNPKKPHSTQRYNKAKVIERNYNNTERVSMKEVSIEKDSDDDDGVIKSQPTVSYSAMNCVICLDILLENESTKLVCGHKFHIVCIEEYNESNSECPLCRKTIKFK